MLLSCSQIISLWGWNCIFKCANSKSHLTGGPQLALIEAHLRHSGATKMNPPSLSSIIPFLPHPLWRICACASVFPPKMCIFLQVFLPTWKKKHIGRRTITRKSYEDLTLSSNSVWRPRHSSNVSSSEGKRRKKNKDKRRNKQNFNACSWKQLWTPTSPEHTWIQVNSSARLNYSNLHWWVLINICTGEGVHDWCSSKVRVLKLGFKASL